MASNFCTIPQTVGADSISARGTGERHTAANRRRGDPTPPYGQPKTIAP